jgi:hypothetical protein
MVTLALAGLLLQSISPPSRPANDLCPVSIRITAGGEWMSYRFNGWRIISAETLVRDLQNGCYNDANPSRVTSVHVKPKARAPWHRVDELMGLLAEHGWPKERVQLE